MTKPTHENCCAPADLSAVTGRLKAKSRKITGPREAILNVMRRLKRPLTTKEIQAQLASECDLATVYRCVHMLESLGLAKRFDFGDGSARYELMEPGERHHHHHLVCTECATIVEVEDCFPPELQDRIASGNGFKSVTHNLEFFGTCPKCQ